MRAYVWTAEAGMVDLGSEDASSAALGTNANGSVVVGWVGNPTSREQHAAVWMGGNVVLLDDQDTPGQANAINGDGTIIVGTTKGTPFTGGLPAVWKWQDGVWVREFLLPSGPNSRVLGGNPEGLSDDGRVIVGVTHDKRQAAALGFVWTAETGMVDANSYLRSLGVQLLTPIFDITSITPSGQTLVH